MMIRIIAILFSIYLVLQAPELDFLQEPMTTQAVVNTTVQFLCQPREQVDQIVWVINGERFSEAPFPLHISTNTTDLSILNVYSALEVNGTVFQCIARKERESFPSDNATLTVIRGINFSGPKDIVAFRDQIVQMHCEPNILTSSFVWYIDGAIADSVYSEYIEFDGNYTLNISSADVLAFKRFQCAVQINDGIRYYSDNATVLIQGELDGVRNVHNVLNLTLNRVTIQWERPFTLQVTNPDGPIMWFEIVIQEVDLKITNITDDFVHIGIGNFSVDFNYTYIITSWNKVGRGNSTTDTLHIPPSSQPSSPTIQIVVGVLVSIVSIIIVILIVVTIVLALLNNHRIGSLTLKKTTCPLTLEQKSSKIISNDAKEDSRHNNHELTSSSSVTFVSASEGVTPDVGVEENIEDLAGRDSAEGKKGDDNKGLEQLVCDSSEKNPLKDIPVTVSPLWKAHAHNSNYYEDSDDLDSDYPIAEDSGFSSGKFPSIPKSTDSMTGMNSQVAPPLTQISEVDDSQDEGRDFGSSSISPEVDDPQDGRDFSSTSSEVYMDAQEVLQETEHTSS